MAKNMNDALEKFVEKNRWALAKNYLDRADHSGLILRGLLFTAATAAIGFIVHENHGAELRSHLLPLIWFGLGAALVFFSWDIQKGKALGKFNILRDGRTPFGPEPPWHKRNYILDRIAGGLIGIGVVWEIAIRLCAT
jgi:hypothetical protein